jgi:hypothetical protein
MSGLAKKFVVIENTISDIAPSESETPVAAVSDDSLTGDNVSEVNDNVESDAGSDESAVGDSVTDHDSVTDDSAVETDQVDDDQDVQDDQDEAVVDNNEVETADTG